VGWSIPVLTYHSIGPGQKLPPGLFRTHLKVLAESGLPSLGAADLDAASRGYLLTFDDGFADLWTHGLSLLQEHGIRAVVFAIPSRAGDGPERPQGAAAFSGSAYQAHGEAAVAPGPHPAFLRWSELAALEKSGAVTVQSHSFFHRMGWVGDEIVGFHLGAGGKAHWSLPQCTGGDIRLGVPLYRRGSALAHRLYSEDGGLRDCLVSWLQGRGGEPYLREKGVRAVAEELKGVARQYREAHPGDGRWESPRDREVRTVEEIARAREVLESRLGGARDELCLPWGEYDEVTLACARQAGVRRVYTLDRGPNSAGRLGFRVHRFEPRSRGSAWLRTRLWIYRSSWRTGVYGRLSGRAAPAVEA